MTVDEFIKKRCIKESKKTVLGWLKKGYVHGVKRLDNGEWCISSVACAPYTKTRKCSSCGIYRAIAKAALNDRIVISDFCTFDDIKLKKYYDDVVNGGFLDRYEVDGITCYKITSKTKELSALSDKKILGLFIEKCSEGVTSAIINKCL